MSNKRKLSIAAGVITLSMMFSNPNRDDFRSFLGLPNSSAEYGIVKRVRNYFVCSVFTYDYSSSSDDYTHKRYLGIVGNFFEVEEDN
jgi:hypothetical protein